MSVSHVFSNLFVTVNYIVIHMGLGGRKSRGVFRRVVWKERKKDGE